MSLNNGMWQFHFIKRRFATYVYIFVFVTYVYIYIMYIYFLFVQSLFFKVIANNTYKIALR